MKFDQIVTLISLAIAILSMVLSHLGIKSQLNYYIKKDKQELFRKEKDLCAEFLGYCKKAKHFGLKDDELGYFTEIYAKLYTIHNKELRYALTEYCDSVLTQNQQSAEKFSNCMFLFEKNFNEKLFL